MFFDKILQYLQVTVYCTFWMCWSYILKISIVLSEALFFSEFLWVWTLNFQIWNFLPQGLACTALQWSSRVRVSLKCSGVSLHVSSGCFQVSRLSLLSSSVSCILCTWLRVRHELLLLLGEPPMPQSEPSHLEDEFQASNLQGWARHLRGLMMA